MEVHRQKKITRYAAVDSGASSSFYPSDYIGENHDPTAAPIRVGCANKEVMTSLAIDIIKFSNLPLAEVPQVQRNLATIAVSTTVM